MIKARPGATRPTQPPKQLLPSSPNAVLAVAHNHSTAAPIASIVGAALPPPASTAMVDAVSENTASHGSLIAALAAEVQANTVALVELTQVLLNGGYAEAASADVDPIVPVENTADPLS